MAGSTLQTLRVRQLPNLARFIVSDASHSCPISLLLFVAEIFL